MRNIWARGGDGFRDKTDKTWFQLFSDVLSAGNEQHLCASTLILVHMFKLPLLFLWKSSAAENAKGMKIMKINEVMHQSHQRFFVQDRGECEFLLKDLASIRGIQPINRQPLSQRSQLYQRINLCGEHCDARKSRREGLWLVLHEASRFCMGIDGILSAWCSPRRHVWHCLSFNLSTSFHLFCNVNAREEPIGRGNHSLALWRLIT